MKFILNPFSVVKFGDYEIPGVLSVTLNSTVPTFSLDAPAAPFVNRFTGSNNVSGALTIEVDDVYRQPLELTVFSINTLQVFPTGEEIGALYYELKRALITSVKTTNSTTALSVMNVSFIADTLTVSEKQS